MDTSIKIHGPPGHSVVHLDIEWDAITLAHIGLMVAGPAEAFDALYFRGGDWLAKLSGARAKVFRKAFVNAGWLRRLRFSADFWPMWGWQSRGRNAALAKAELRYAKAEMKKVLSLCKRRPDSIVSVGDF